MSQYEENEVIAKLPAHLKQFIHNQEYSQYTPINQAVWRYVMRKNVDYLKTVAHGSYVEGLSKTGITTEKIPNMYGMNRILKEIGWAAVAVDGFIPPTAFMEFQAFNVLVIAQDMRQIGHIEYTPAPDIVHEAAGHAPIIANPEYAEYLRRFGEIGSKAISSSQDYKMYEAIRHLSIVKEDPNATKKEIQEAEEEVWHLQENMGEPSEMAQIRNLHWWTVEYGLIGTLDNPKIYGAGLLSSIGESKWCMKPEVKKIPYDIQAAKLAFDITKPQPQLFVTPDFAHLSFVLEQFANNMALRKGGSHGIELLINSGELGTIELNTGIQISGHFKELIKDENNQPIWVHAIGETALSYRDHELIGHGREIHKNGFATTIGRLENINIPMENMSPYDLDAYKIREGERVKLNFEGGINVEGEVITGTRNRYGEILLITFRNCTVKHKDKVIFDPSWGNGIFEMAVGSSVTSAFARPADPKSFDLVTHVPSETTRKVEYSKERIKLHVLYAKVREIRQSENEINATELEEIFNESLTLQPNWLLHLEIYELCVGKNLPFAKDVKKALEHTLETDKDVAHLIKDGLSLLEKTDNLVVV